MDELVREEMEQLSNEATVLIQQLIRKGASLEQILGILSRIHSIVDEVYASDAK